MNSITFDDVRLANKVRTARWFPGGIFGWNEVDWACAMAGEAGEVCNEVKKLRRLDHQIAGDDERSHADIVRAIGRELADTVLYLDLLAQRLDLNLGEEVAKKFNEVSVKRGFPERLPEGGGGDNQGGGEQAVKALELLLFRLGITGVDLQVGHVPTVKAEEAIRAHYTPSPSTQPAGISQAGGNRSECHALRTPCPIETMLTWCGKLIDDLSSAEHYVTNLKNHCEVNCPDCRTAMGEALEDLVGFDSEDGATW